jgi:hypothetical protein
VNDCLKKERDLRISALPEEKDGSDKEDVRDTVEGGDDDDDDDDGEGEAEDDSDNDRTTVICLRRNSKRFVFRKFGMLERLFEFFVPSRSSHLVQ